MRRFELPTPSSRTRCASQAALHPDVFGSVFLVEEVLEVSPDDNGPETVGNGFHFTASTQAFLAVGVYDPVFLEPLYGIDNRLAVQNIDDGILKNISSCGFAIEIFAAVGHIAVDQNREMIGQGATVSHFGRDDTIARERVSPGVKHISFKIDVGNDGNHIPFECRKLFDAFFHFGQFMPVAPQYDIMDFPSPVGESFSQFLGVVDHVHGAQRPVVAWNF